MEAKQKSVISSVEGIFEVKATKKLPDGVHKGVIVDVEFRHTPYEYTDIILEKDGVQVRVGYPSVVTEDSKLGKLFQRFGFNFKIGDKVDVRQFVGLKCQFQTTTSPSKKDGKEYSNVLEATLKP